MPGPKADATSQRRPAARADDVSEPRQAVIDVVLDVLTTHGYDAVRVRDVSRRARVSSKTIYRLFETREELIVTALEHWMAANVYVKVAMPEADESLYDVLMRFLRALFDPWERYPGMLEAYYRAKLTPAGARLGAEGTRVARRVGEALLIADSVFAGDLEEIMRNVADGLISRFVQGEIEVGDIVPRLEIAAARLTRTQVTHGRGKSV